MTQSPVRFREIDALRGLAVLLMSVFHAAFIGDLFALWDFNWSAPFWTAMAHGTRILFWWIFGVSIAISRRTIWGQCVRGFQLFAAGLLASLATWFIFGEDFVRFGILQFLAVSAPLTRLFKGRLPLAFCASMFFLFSFSWASSLDFLLFSPWDYVRVSWLAVPIWGLIWGEMVYAPNMKSWVRIHFAPLEFLGRHALAFYLLQFPLLYFSLQGLSNLIS